MTTIIGVPVVPDSDYVNLITPAEAIAEPVLADVSTTDARLVQLISVASAQIQRYLGYFYAVDETVAADLKFATSQYVAYLWSQDSISADGDLESESLGQYHYNRGRGLATTNARLDRILGLLFPFLVKVAPIIVQNRNTSATLTEDRED